MQRARSNLQPVFSAIERTHHGCEAEYILGGDGKGTRDYYLTCALHAPCPPLECVRFRVQTAAAKLATGCSEEEANTLWAKYDKDKDETLSAKESAGLVADVIDLKIAALAAEMDKLKDAKKNEALIKNVLTDLDADGDGTVTKAEFIAAAMRGYVLTINSEETSEAGTKVEPEAETNVVEPEAKRAKAS